MQLSSPQALQFSGSAQPVLPFITIASSAFIEILAATVHIMSNANRGIMRFMNPFILFFVFVMMFFSVFKFAVSL